MGVMRLLLWSVLLAACAPPEKPTAPERVAIVIAEKSSTGAHLVAIDESGDRQFEMIYGHPADARETHPAISPDGRWLLYASSQKLWLAQIGVDRSERQITHGPGIETQPVWAPDGKSFVFATTGEGHDFNLRRILFAHDKIAGESNALTHGAAHEVSPSFAPDGSIVYASAALDSYDSHLERLMPDGTIVQVTAGPNEGAPAVSPDGTRIAYSCRQTTEIKHTDENGIDMTGAHKIGTIQHRDICVRPFAMPADSTETIAPIVSLPPSDEDGPVWSRDGRYLFATSAVWGENGVLFSSVIFIDLKEQPRKARILLDHGGPAPRMTPAIATSQLISADLAQNPEYLSSLARIMEKRVEQQVREERADSLDSASP